MPIGAPGNRSPVLGRLGRSCGGSGTWGAGDCAACWAAGGWLARKAHGHPEPEDPRCLRSRVGMFLSV